jgi:hypothetical protein
MLGDPDLDENYLLRRDGFEPIGNWSGPAGYWRLESAIDTNEALPFMNDLGVGAVQIPSAPLDGLGVPLEHTLTKSGFCSLAIPGTQTKLLVRYSRGCKNLVVPAELRSAPTPMPLSTPVAFYPAGVIMPDNADSSDGVYAVAERDRCCFLASSARLHLHKPLGAKHIFFRFLVPQVPPFANEPERVYVTFNGVRVGNPVALAEGWHDVQFTLPDRLAASRDLTAELRMTISFVPSDLGLNADTRRLSILLTSVSYR